MYLFITIRNSVQIPQRVQTFSIPLRSYEPWLFLPFRSIVPLKRTCDTYILCPQLTSVNPSHDLSIMVVRKSTDRLTYLHEKCALTFTLMSATSTYMPSGQVSDFEHIGLLIRHSCLLCDFCSSNQRFTLGFLQITPRGGHPCRPANSSLSRVFKGLTPSREYALLGTPKTEESTWLSSVYYLDIIVPN